MRWRPSPPTRQEIETHHGLHARERVSLWGCRGSGLQGPSIERYYHATHEDGFWWLGLRRFEGETLGPESFPGFEWVPLDAERRATCWPPPEAFDPTTLRPDWSRSVLEVTVSLRGHLRGSADPLPDFEAQLRWLRARVSPGVWRLPEDRYDRAVRELALVVLRDVLEGSSG